MKRQIKAIIGVAMIIIILSAAGVWVLNNTNTKDYKDKKAYNGYGGTFKNTLAEIDTPDPSIVYKDGYYYMTFTHNGTDIIVMQSRTLDFRHAKRKTVWYPPVDTMYSANLWAPEIQLLQGNWYIYFAADNGVNENHRMYALEADTGDPMGSYTFKGQVTDKTDKWAIDGLVLEHDNQLYFVWSGWEGDVNIAQNTYIAPMSDPLTISGPRVLISKPDLEWERAGGPPYINEGQAILKKDGRVFLVYSGAGSWTPFYSIGTLMLEPGADPLIAANWKKLKKPLMQMDKEAQVYGPGHNTFVKSPDGTEDWIVYHATSGIQDGWNNRKARAQQVEWSEKGIPQFGKPLSLDTAIAVPSGSGVFQAEYADWKGNAVEFGLIPSSVDTTKPLRIHYQNTTGSEQTIQILSNGEKTGSVKLPPTKEESFSYIQVTVPLKGQMNTLGMSGITEGIDIRSIELPRYEAEFAQTFTSNEAVDNPFTSGVGGVKIEEGKGIAVVFSNVRVSKEGKYEAVLAVSNPYGQDTKFQVSINGGESHVLTIPTTERNKFDEISIKILLKSGINEIKLEDATGDLFIDYLDIKQSY